MSLEHDKQIAQPSVTEAPAESPAQNFSEPAAAPPVTDLPLVEPVAAADNGEPMAVEAPEEAYDTSAAAGETEESSEPMDQLIEQYAAAPQSGGEGELVEGRVIAVIDLGVVVDVGGKAEGLVPAQEFVATGVDIPFEPGQRIEVQFLNQEKDGYLLLSYLRAHRRKVWDEIERAYRAHLPLTGKVAERIKGGLVVEIGVRAFLPASQVDLRPVRDLEPWMGQEITCAVLKMNRKRGNVVVSRRVLLEQELSAQRAKLLESMVEGAVITGKVKNITDYGAFVDLGGLDGLLHVTDLAWSRVKHPSEVLASGEEIQVKVLKFDREKMRVSLGRKQLLPDPWIGVAERYSTGTHVHGTVVGVTDYGAFIELEPGVEGLVHVSEMSWSKRNKHPSKIVSIGDLVEVVVLDVKHEQRRISLGLKQALPDPWETLAQKYPIGTLVSGRVRNLTDFGAFVEIEEGIDGLIHVGDISWTERIKHPSEKFKKGDTVEAKVLKIDTEQRRLSLGVKQVNDIWGDWFAAHRVGQLVRGKVVRTATFGAFVELAEGIEGLCHISEIEERRRKGDQDRQPKGAQTGAAALEPGQVYDFKILKVDPDSHKIGLSYRAAIKQAERRDMEEYRSSKSSPTATIGDAILAKRGSS
jgi:small subunit ribosomal protein S1